MSSTKPNVCNGYGVVHMQGTWIELYFAPVPVASVHPSECELP